MKSPEPVWEEITSVMERLGRRVQEFGASVEAILRDQEAEARATAWRKRARESGLPASFHGVTFEGSEPTDAIRRAALFLTEDARRGRCLVLSGPTGVGKTWAAAAAVRAWVDQAGPTGGRPAAFWYFGALAEELLAGGPDARAAMHGACKTALLVLDDLGVEYLKPGGALEASLDRIVWTREADRRATLITTNLSGEDLKDRLSERIVDRLRGEWGEVFQIPGPSLRRKA